MKNFLIIALLSFSIVMFGSTTLLSESFEGTFPPAGWTVQTTGLGFAINGAKQHTGIYSMWHNYQFIGDQDDWIITSVISVPVNFTTAALSFWQYEDWADYYDTHEVLISTDMSNWDMVYSGPGTEDTWTNVTIDISSYSGENIYVAFHYVGNTADCWYIDDVEVTTYGGFIERETGIEALEFGDIDWADFTHSGNFDIALIGNTDLSIYDTYTNLYSCNSGTSFGLYGSLPGVRGGSVQMKDIGGDTATDIIYTGSLGGSSIRYTNIFENHTLTFADQMLDNDDKILQTWSGSTDLGDYDNDGDEDILITGVSSSSGYDTEIYRNDGNYTYTNIDAGLRGVKDSDADWGDYDNDGDLDLIVTGNWYNAKTAIIYRNDSGVFTDINASLTGVINSSVDWGDYDSDGDLDLVITGMTTIGRSTKIYNNNNGVFNDISASLTGVENGSGKWGDYDNDGDLDLLITGYTVTGGISKLYRNDSGVFSDSGMEFQGVSYGKGLWADHDRDGDLDVLLYGNTGSGYILLIYENLFETANTPPTAPTELNISNSNGLMTFSFTPSTDTETPSSGLTYNAGFKVRDININSMNCASDGTRYIVCQGNIFNNTSWSIDVDKYMRPQENTPVNFYVQAIDNNFIGSPVASFSNSSFRKGDLSLRNESILNSAGELSWDADYYSEMDSYVIQFDEVSGFTSPFEESIELSKDGMKGLNYSVVISDLTSYASMVDGQTYYWRIKPLYSGSIYTTYFTAIPNSFTLYKQNQLPTAPVSGFSPANDDLETTTPMLNWNAGSDPDGHAEDLKYRLEVDNDNTFSTPVFTDTTDPGETFSQLTGLTDGLRYYYRVKTIDTDLAESAWSATQQFITVMPPQSVKIS